MNVGSVRGGHVYPTGSLFAVQGGASRQYVMKKVGMLKHNKR